ncbi:MAG: HemK2/MTQ2 family protein methyltransferase [archaeon]
MPRPESICPAGIAQEIPLNSTYRPREDSFLLLKAIQNNSLSGLQILDIGTGSGLLAIECAKRGAIVTAADVDEDAVRALRLLVEQQGLEIKITQSDLFSSISERYDLIVFNPPYLPDSRDFSDTAIDGGRTGREVIERFLRLLPEHLEKKGRCLLLVSSLNSPDKLIAEFPNLSFKQVAAENVFFEKLLVFEITVQSGLETGSSPQ